jgi:hypothetical protein
MERQALRAKTKGFRTYCATFGTDVDTEIHRVIARQTNAAYDYSGDRADLTDMSVDIVRRLPPAITQ